MTSQVPASILRRHPQATVYLDPLRRHRCCGIVRRPKRAGLKGRRMANTPQFVDLQVNGYAGVDFNADDLSAEQLHFACERLREDGVTGILATVITAELPKMSARLQRIAEIRAVRCLGGRSCVGFAHRGTFINETPGFVGAHPPQDVRPGDVEVMKN